MTIKTRYLAPALLAVLTMNANAAPQAAVQLTTQAADHSSDQAAKRVTKKLKEQDLIYTHDQMFNFDIAGYLAKKAPHLVPHAETISHWAGVSSISPKILIALMEHQTTLVSAPADKAMTQPFGVLSKETSFREQVRDVSMRLAGIHYDKVKAAASHSVQKTNEASSISQLLSGKSSTKTQSRAAASFDQTYGLLFKANATVSNRLTTAAVAPPSNLLQLPYPVGSSWRHGGSHSNTGSGTVYSSLDFNNGGFWGSNLNHLWVKSSAPGTVKVHSSCNMEVIHADGWSTQYYHLDNIQYSTNQSVGRNSNLANYASNKNQALCEGGQSTGPHQHFSLKRHGSYASLNGVKLSGYTVHTGSSNYDDNCNRFWLESANGGKNCAGNLLHNPGVGDGGTTGPDPINVSQANISVNQGQWARYTYALPAGYSSMTVSISGSNGDADLFLNHGSQSSASNWDCRPFLNGSNEVCTISNPASGTWYLDING